MKRPPASADQADIGEGRVELADGAVNYRVRYRRRRTIGLYVLEDGTIEVRAPLDCPSGLLQDFVADRAEWLAVVLARRRARPRPERAVYESGGRHPFLGEMLELQVGRGRHTLVHREGERLVVQHRRPEPEHVARAVRLWYARQAEPVFEPLIRLWYPALGLPRAQLPILKVRSMRRRWGSCSSRGGINLNLWLLRAPPECVEYVVVHELCHLREFNHGAGFQALVDRLLPDWRPRSHRLDAHQRRFGVAPVPVG